MYAYTEPYIGTEATSHPSKPTNGERVVADIHSHGEYNKSFGAENNQFSDGLYGGDKLMTKKDMQELGVSDYKAYLTTPNGSLLEYDDPVTDKTEVLCTDMPSDPGDPDRQNEIDPPTYFGLIWDLLGGIVEPDVKNSLKNPKSEYPGSAGPAGKSMVDGPAGKPRFAPKRSTPCIGCDGPPRYKNEDDTEKGLK